MNLTGNTILIKMCIRDRVRQERRSQANGAEEIGGDDGLGIDKIGLLHEQLFRAHDAGVVDEEVERGILDDRFGSKLADCLLSLIHILFLKAPFRLR